MAVDIQEQVSEYFHNAQLNAAGHRKLIHALRKLHLDSSEVGSQGEQEFFLALIHCLNVLLSVRKNEETVTRCIRFLVGFIVCSAERDEASILGGSTPTTRLIENIMLYALEGVDTKERLVRVRLTQVLVACVNAMDELSDAVWSVFRVKMTERLFDREAAVRIQAVHAMARLQGLPLTESSGGLSVRDVFLELLAHDPVAEVRKAVLGQIDVMEDTLGAILLRRRDVDASIRKFFYSRKMSEIDVRVLSMKQRDEVLRSGLTDRDGTVRRTCIEMVFGRWIQSADNNLIQLLISLDVIGHTKVAEYALRAFYEMVPEMFSSFPPAFFENLTPETAISLRVYCERAGTELLPEMSELAEHIRRIYETILSSGGEGDEGYRTEAEFILCELFKVASTYDGSDEMGRRVVQDVLLEILSNLELGDGVFTEALTLLSKRSGDLGEFLQVVGQLVTDLHELYSVPTTGLDEQLQRSLEALTLAGGSGASPLPEDIRIIAQLRCLEIVSVALQLPSISLNKHPAILSLTSDVVIPSVNSPYAVIQSKGLLCLGLVCTLSLDLSCEYLDLLIDFFQQGQDDTRLTALKVFI